MADSPSAWRGRGTELVVPEGRIFFVDLPAREATAEAKRTPLLVLHGFPSSSWDFSESAAILSARRRVVLFDFLGFGLSDKPSDAGYSLFEQAEIAIAVVQKTQLERVHVWAHDMGTSVATELLARRERGLLPFEIASLTLMNGSVHVEMASLTPGQRVLRSMAGDAFVRLAGPRIFAVQMKRIFARPISDASIEAMWSLLSRADGHLRLPKIIRYLEERVRFRRRWVGALERVDLPVLIAWGVKDPVALLSIGEKLAENTPNSTLQRWDDLGHYPQMEDPKRVADDIEGFLDLCDRQS